MPAVEDWINKPQDVVKRIFEKYGLSECHTKVVEYFTNRILEQGSSNRIPSLNDIHIQALKSDTLVRFRCMIQDMYDPNYFLGAYEVKDSFSKVRTLKCGLYKEFADTWGSEEVDENSPKNVTVDRLSYYCISVPGENEWVKECYLKKNTIPHSPSASTSSTPVRCKRPCDDLYTHTNCNEEMDDIEMADYSMDLDYAEKRCKKLRNAPEGHTSNDCSGPFPDLNFPLPGMDGKACIARLCGKNLNFKLNDIVEFIGILSLDPNPATCSGLDNGCKSSINDNEECDAEYQAHNPPSSLVPRLHVLVANKLNHNNPTLPSILKLEPNSDGIHELISQSSSVREELLATLTDLLLGDKLAAEYFLCHLIATVYFRNEVISLGKFTLNITNVLTTGNYTKRLYDIVKQLTTQSYFLPLSLDNLNCMDFSPSKNYTTNRLNTGILQLSNHTHLVIDETAITVGQLTTKGVKNVTALNTVIKWQKAVYDFDFHKTDFCTDLPILVLSEGKSLLSNDFTIPLCSTVSKEEIDICLQCANERLTETFLSDVRKYLTWLKLAQYDFSMDLQQVVEKDFVDMKQKGQCVSADDLHLLLDFARLLSLSFGEMTLKQETWEKAKSMEIARKNRFQS